MKKNDCTFETYSLATIGAVQGVFKEVIQPELTAKRAWAAIALGVTAYELACPKGELLSEQVSRWTDRHPYITRGAIGVTALHLAGVLPKQVDPFSRFTQVIKRY